MTMEDYEDDDNAASGFVSDDISKYLHDKFPKPTDDLYGNADAGFKDWLNEKFPK